MLIDLHIEIGDDDLDKYSHQQPDIECIVTFDLVSVQSVEAVAVREERDQEVGAVANEEDSMDRVHARIAVDFA